jgi:hypothetical protein
MARRGCRWDSGCSAPQTGIATAGRASVGPTTDTSVPPGRTKPDGLAVDFVVEFDRAQLSEIVQRVRDGRLRTNIGNVSTLDDAVAAFNQTKADQREDNHPRSSVSDTHLLGRQPQPC